MPVLAFGKQWFDPYPALAQGFLVRLRLLIGPDAIQILLLHAPAEGAALFAGGTLSFELTVVAVFGTRAIAARALRRMWLIKAEFFAGWTAVDIALCFVAKAVCTEERGAVIQVRRGDIGVD